ncbi:hypothetical protein G5714_005590 [Onychostoma macrolepis]|uniref:Uncharacterized protein n=1 Tax=Onychostoma macrolepis TaxID=369639 RepID=A0A7J6D1G8_9TELE|nr:hypothetical protein G5714_005590 [Onychostoma macrolepis]
MNSVAEWTQINENIDFIVEIKVNGHESFWNNRHNRIKAFRDAAASGNFSILIRDVQLSDLGLYRCKLYTDINCSLGYKEIEISLAAVEFSLLNNWQLIVAGGGGGFLILFMITVCVYYAWTKRESDNTAMRPGFGTPANHGQSHYPQMEKTWNRQKNDEITHASVVPKSRNCHDSEVILYNNPVNSSASDLVSQETVLYATVKQRERR